MSKREKDILKLLEINENAKPDEMGFIENGHTRRRKAKEKNCQEFISENIFEIKSTKETQKIIDNIKEIERNGGFFNVNKR